MDGYILRIDTHKFFDKSPRARRIMAPSFADRVIQRYFLKKEEEMEHHILTQEEIGELFEALAANDEPVNPLAEMLSCGGDCGKIPFMEETELPTEADPFAIDRVIFHEPATIVLWQDGTKTVVKAQEGNDFSKEVGLAMCIAKKAYGNKGSFNEVFKKYIPEYAENPKASMSIEVTAVGSVRKLSPEEEKEFRKEHGMF